MQYLLFSKQIFSVKYVNTFLAGESTFEEGLVAIVITVVAILFVLFQKYTRIKNER